MNLDRFDLHRYADIPRPGTFFLPRATNSHGVIHAHGTACYRRCLLRDYRTLSSHRHKVGVVVDLMYAGYERVSGGSFPHILFWIPKAPGTYQLDGHRIRFEVYPFANMYTLIYPEWTENKVMEGKLLPSQWFSPSPSGLEEFQEITVAYSESDSVYTVTFRGNLFGRYYGEVNQEEIAISDIHGVLKFKYDPSNEIDW